MNTSTLQAVLFDMDGTLFDSERLWDVSLADLASKLGGVLSADARQRLVGGNLLTTVGIVHADLQVDADEQESASWLLERTGELFTRGVPWRPGARAIVEEVRARGIPTALVTSSYRKLVDIALAQLEAEVFDVVVCGDDVAHPKPDPESYLTAASRLGVEPDQCIALEDSTNGIGSASRAGCLVIAVPEEPAGLPPTSPAIVQPLAAVTVDRMTELFTAHRGGGQRQTADSS